MILCVVYEGGANPSSTSATLSESTGLRLPVPSVDVHWRMGHHFKPAQGHWLGIGHWLGMYIHTYMCLWGHECICAHVSVLYRGVGMKHWDSTLPPTPPFLHPLMNVMNEATNEASSIYTILLTLVYFNVLKWTVDINIFFSCNRMLWFCCPVIFIL